MYIQMLPLIFLNLWWPAVSKREHRGTVVLGTSLQLCFSKCGTGPVERSSLDCLRLEMQAGPTPDLLNEKILSTRSLGNFAYTLNFEKHSSRHPHTIVMFSFYLLLECDQYT